MDQGWIKVDQGGSEVDQAHFLVPGLREPLENVGNSEWPRILQPGEPVPLYNLKETNAVSVARRNVERREERCFSRIL